MLLIGDGFTPDRFILQGKSHQFVDLRVWTVGRFLLRPAPNAAIHSGNIKVDTKNIQLNQIVEGFVQF